MISFTLVASSFPAPNVEQLSNSDIEVSIDLPFITTIFPLFTISLVLPDINLFYTDSGDKGVSSYAFNVPLSQVGIHNVSVTYYVYFGSYTTTMSNATVIEGNIIIQY